MSNESFINLSMLVVLIVAFALASICIPRYFSMDIVLNLLANNWYIVILGIGVTFLLITGNFDMSVGGIIAMSGALSAYFCQTQQEGFSELATGLGMDYGVSVVLALLGSLVIGAINAFFIAKLKVASIIVTLGTMSIARGVAEVLTQGAQRSAGLPDIYGVVGNWTLFGPIKIAVVIALVLVLLALFVEKKTTFGRRTYLIGANQQAARLSGIKVERHITLLYLLSSLLAGITGIILASESRAAISTRGEGFEFNALVVTLLGGTSINGGFGSVAGTVVGAFILGVIASAATSLLLRPEWQFILKGVVTFFAILAQRYALDKRNA
ncbi:MAG: ABC transporter permease [Christensenellaceae bacterium]|nr:ABC transporter permease [Christensenellaceae bacterium]